MSTSMNWTAAGRCVPALRVAAVRLRQSILPTQAIRRLGNPASPGSITGCTKIKFDGSRRSFYGGQQRVLRRYLEHSSTVLAHVAPADRQGCNVRCLASSASGDGGATAGAESAVADVAAASSAEAAAGVEQTSEQKAETVAAGSGNAGAGRRKERRMVKEYKKRLRIADIKNGPDEGMEQVGRHVELRGWVRTVRSQKAFSFIELNDGSSLSGIQVVATPEIEGYQEVEGGGITTGAAVSVEGEVVESQGKGQKIEIKAQKLTLVGGSDGSTYPLQKKRHSLEYLRTIAHLRPRTNTIGAVSRVRSALAQASHRFFQSHGFVWVASPIITASDCEGAGDQFRVTTLLPGTPDASTPVKAIPTNKDGSVDWSQDFFKRPAYLTVSGQLNAEIYACALHDVYTFGPTFRAENSNTSRHLAEFWMIEPELAFADLADDMACATAYLKYILQEAMSECAEDFRFFDKFVEPGIIQRLTSVVESEFEHVPYTDAIQILKKAKTKFDYPVEWGIDLQSEHERYLTEKAFKNRPIIVTDYPKDIKAFYMRLNDDGKTVAAMDVLVPRVGELIGGSQREERLEVLEGRMRDVGLDPQAYWWYLDLRRYGSVPHAGFGLGFERLVQFATGIENIQAAAWITDIRSGGRTE
ncbi:unnamed protein product [Closterium sp. NIES-53]